MRRHDRHVARVDRPKRPLIEWVLAQFPGTSRRRAKEWIETGRVTVGERPLLKPHLMLDDPGRALTLRPRRTTTGALERPWRVHPLVTVLYLDTSLAVVNKMPGLLAVPEAEHERSALGILQDVLAGRSRPAERPDAQQHALSAGLRGRAPLRVHRIDQFTSGVLCFAMTRPARAQLIEQFRAHTVTRQYLAFVDGRLNENHGTWRHWLWAREGERMQRVAGRPAARSGRAAAPAVTHFEVLAEFPVASRGTVTKLRLTLETGRTHQIRAQAAAMGVPLIGDRLYHPAYSVSQDSRPSVTVPFDRQALHAERLALDHPEPPHQRLQWIAPLPKDLRSLETMLRRRRR